MRMSMRWLFAIVAMLAVVLAIAAGGFYFMLNAPVALRTPVDVTVEPGESVRSISERLAGAGVVRNAPILLFLARATGADREIRHGEHRFEGTLTPSQVLEELLRTPTPVVRLTIAEGSTWAEIGAQLERDGLATAAAYREAVCDPALIASLGARSRANCAEGYLFPDTYNLAPGMTAKDIVALQVGRFHEVTSELMRDFAPTPDNAFLKATNASPAAQLSDPRARAEFLADSVIMASIVEAEAKLPEERQLISSVFHNRLRRGVRLQADPTVIYGRAAAGTPWDHKLLHKHLREPGPYNTYTSDGLPPGPICNPGRSALYAALHPAPTKYLYFVARGDDGSHEFNERLADHNRAVARLREMRRRTDGLTFAEPSLSLPSGTSAKRRGSTQ
jgi:UPF0755 protein